MDFSYATTTSESDWQEWATRNIEVSDGGISLTQTTTIHKAGIEDSIVDIDTAPDGTLALLSDSGSLYEYDPGTDTVQLLDNAATDSAATSATLAATRDEVFVADDTEDSIRTISDAGEEGSLQVDGTAPAILAHGRGSLHVVDDEGTITLAGGEAGPNLSLDSPVDVAFGHDVLYAIETVDDRRVVRAYRNGTRLDSTDSRVPSDAFEVGDRTFTPTAIAVPQDAVVLAGRFDDREQGGLFEWDPLTETYSQITDLVGTCHTLVGRTDGEGSRTMYATVGESRTCIELTEVGGHRRHPDQDKHVGFAATQYDSGRAGTEWHRVIFELARSSVDTQVRVWYHATDDPTVLPLDADDAETDGGLDTVSNAPEPLVPDVLTQADEETLEAIGADSLWEVAITDAEALAARSDSVTRAAVTSLRQRAFEALERRVESDWRLVDEPDSQDVLLDHAEGRYLYVAVELVGTPTASPLVDSVTAYCPRQSYLRYMPELYQQDETSSAFLERFLSVFETSFVDVQRDLDEITRYFDPDGVPSESLAWLEDWLAADEYRDWPESARREYLARAPELYKLRGTRAGLRETIELYLRHATDAAVEPGSGRTTRGHPSGSESLETPRDTPTGHRLFIVEPADIDSVDGLAAGHSYDALMPHDRSFVVFCGPFESSETRSALETIVETEKPAHVEASVHTLDEEFVLGTAAFLGLNAKLGTESFALGEAPLGKDTYLSPAESH